MVRDPASSSSIFSSPPTPSGRLSPHPPPPPPLRAGCSRSDPELALQRFTLQASARVHIPRAGWSNVPRPRAWCHLQPKQSRCTAQSLQPLTSSACAEIALSVIHGCEPYVRMFSFRKANISCMGWSPVAVFIPVIVFNPRWEKNARTARRVKHINVVSYQ